jgi:adenylate cyclase
MLVGGPGMVRQRQSSDVAAPIDAALDTPNGVASAEEIRAAVARILTSEEFSRSQRLSRFLQFIVGEALAGREAQIKAYTIALAVCDRNDHFDPSLDPIVRIEAGRLRRALQHYYLTEGHRDSLVIDVPKGAYRPVITARPVANRDVANGASADTTGLSPRALVRLSRDAASPQNKGSKDRRRVVGSRPGWLVATIAVLSFALGVTLFDRHPEQQKTDPAITASQHTAAGLIHPPTLLILPFYNYGADPDQSYLAEGITNTVERHLAEQPGLTIRRAVNRDGRAALRHERGASIDLIVSGSVKRSDSGVRVFVQLTNIGDETSVWSQHYDREMTGGIIDYEEEIARLVAAYVTDLSTKVTLLRN